MYTFSVTLCDNEIDRDFERFSDDALSELAKLFVGKTGISDHNPKSENQSSRIYSCNVEKVAGRKNSLGMDYLRVVAKAYIPKTAKNEELISDIDSGIKKETSVGCAVSKHICSICGCDLQNDSCNHIKGKQYDEQLCHTILCNPTDAYEWSFVAVPAQREAGVIKSFGMKRGDSMKEILENLSKGEAVCLTSDEAVKLYSAYRELEENASIGKQYKSDLRNEVIKLCGIAEPEMVDSLDTVTSKMTVSELKSFRDFYSKKSAQKTTPIPQLFANNKQEKVKTDYSIYSV